MKRPVDSSGPSRRAFLSQATVSLAASSALPASAAASQSGLDDRLPGVRLPGANSVTRSLSDKLGERVSVLDKGAAGNGVDDDSQAVSRAIADAPAGSAIWFPPGRRYKVAMADVTGKRLTIDARGAVIDCFDAGRLNDYESASQVRSAFVKTDHGNMVAIEGGQWVGPGRALNFIGSADPTDTELTQVDLSVLGCRFETGDYAICTKRIAQSIISHVVATRGKGLLYRRRSINCDVHAAYVTLCQYGVNDDGDGSSRSAGLKLNGGLIMGCEYGVRSRGTDYVGLFGLMCDYNDRPGWFEGVKFLDIVGGYYTSRTAHPAIRVGSGASRPSYNAVVKPSHVFNHSAEAADCIELDGIVIGDVEVPDIAFFRRYGIVYRNCEFLTIKGCTFNRDPAGSFPAPRCIKEDGGTNQAIRISDNNFSTPSGAGALDVGPHVRIADNRGFVTRNSGTVTVPRGTSSITVPHGLDRAPPKSAIGLTWGNAAARDNQPFVESVASMGFALVFASATAASAEIGWRAESD